MPLFIAKSMWTIKQLNQKRIPHENRLVKGYSAGDKIIIPQTNKKDFSVTVPIYTTTLKKADEYIPLPHYLNQAHRQFLKDFNNRTKTGQLETLNQLIELYNEDTKYTNDQVVLTNYRDLHYAKICLEHIIEKNFYTTASVRDDIKLTITNIGRNIKENQVKIES